MAFLNATFDLWSEVLKGMVKNEQYGIRITPKVIKDKKQDDQDHPANSSDSPQASRVSGSKSRVPLLSN